MNTERIDYGAVAVGVLFMVVGAVLGLDAYLAWDLSPAVTWSGLLILAGLAVLARSLPRAKSHDERTAAQ
jgi:hypothetical protein